MWSTFIKLRLCWLNVSVDVFDLRVFVFVCQLSSTRRSSGDSQREDERRSRTGGHRSDGHRPIGELWRPWVDEWKWFLLSAPLLHHPSSPLLLRWALTASEVCGVTSQLWRRWSSSRFSTPKSSTTSRSSRPGLYIMYISSLFYTLLDQYQELSIKHHQFIDVWGQYFYCFYFVIVKDNY